MPFKLGMTHCFMCHNIALFDLECLSLLSHPVQSVPMCLHHLLSWLGYALGMSSAPGPSLCSPFSSLLSAASSTKGPTRELPSDRWKGNRDMQPSLFDHAVWLDYLYQDLLPRVLAKGRQQGQVLRIWSVGCQSGDEATVLALALDTLLREEMDAWQIRIFATDTNQEAPARAREHVYAEPPETDRWRQNGRSAFEGVPGCYRLAKRLRRTLV